MRTKLILPSLYRGNDEPLLPLKPTFPVLISLRAPIFSYICFLFYCGNLPLYNIGHRSFGERAKSFIFLFLVSIAIGTWHYSWAH